MSLRNIRHEAFSLSSLEHIFEMVSPATEKLSQMGQKSQQECKVLSLLSGKALESFPCDPSTMLMGQCIYLSPFSNVSLISILSIDLYALSSAVTAR